MRKGDSSVGEPHERGTLGTVRNAVVLLGLLSEGPAYQQLTDLAERSGLSVPTVHRLLRSLVLADLVEQDPGSSRYGLGPELARLAQRYLARLPILGALAPYLIPLRDKIGGTVHIAVLVRGSVVYVDRIDGPDGGLYRDTHRVLPALTTAAGLVLAARSDDDGWKLALEAAPSELGALAEVERENWRTAAHVVSTGSEPDDPHEVAVPVNDPGGRAVAALAATIPADSAGPDQARANMIAAHLTRAARAAGKALNRG